MNRNLWRPRLRELPAQCASCPFRQGNDAEFKVIVRKLRKKHGLKKTTKGDVSHARFAIKIECYQHGEFACHHTVYKSDMSELSQSEHRQCPGATAHFKRLD